MKLFILRPYRFIIYASLLITGMVLVSACKKNFSPQEAAAVDELHAFRTKAARLNNISAGTLQVITFPNSVFSGTAAVVSDGAGNIYIADSASHVIRKINTAGVANVFAGTVNNASLTDGQGTAARFNRPTGLAIDGTGNLYVADKNNHAIRKITPAGLVTTFAGGKQGTADGPDTSAQFSFPSGVAVSASGTVFVADAGNNKIRKISPAGVVGPHAGTGTVGKTDDVNFLAQFNNPTGVAVNADGTIVYVADAGNNKIRIITGGETNTLAGGGVTGVMPGFAEGTGSDALFNKPIGVAVDATGNVYVSDKNNNRIRQITPAQVVSTYAGTGVADLLDGVSTVAKFNSPNGVAIDALGIVYVADAGNNRIREITVAMIVSTLAGSGVAGPATGIGTSAQFHLPTDVDVDASGNIIVADLGNSQIRIISQPGANVTVLAGTGTFGYVNGSANTAQFGFPASVAVDAANNKYVADWANERIRKITSTGVVSTLAGDGIEGYAEGTGTAARFDTPRGIAVDAAGNVYVADQNNNRIRKITPAGVVSTLAGNGTSGNMDGSGSTAQFSSPTGVAVDGSGNVYVADAGNNRIRKITPLGVVSTLAGKGPGFADGTDTSSKFNTPFGVALDAAGNIYVADQGNNRIRKITPSGIVSTLAGNGVSGVVDGPGPLAEFFLPYNVAIDAAGAIYVADGGFSNRIRKIQ